MRILKYIYATVIVLIGIFLMAYPFYANYLFENRQDSVVNAYKSNVESLESTIKERIISDAIEYNKALLNGHIQLHDPFTEDIGYDQEDYYSMLALDNSEVMSYINIPCIKVSLPVYHGTSAAVLENGVGHLQGTSLPIGGESTHCVLTGHTGLSNAKLFTDLTQLEEGDMFILTTMGEKLAYEVDQIKVVEPSDTSDLSVISGEDYVTLVTCTPYGVNSHRLLVRGTRVEYTEEYENTSIVVTKSGNSEWMYQYKISLYIAIGLIIIVCIIYSVASCIGRKHHEK